MRAKLAALSIFVFMGAGICSAQTAASQADYSTVYCSGFVSDQKVPDATRLVSGEQSNVKILFARGDYVTINRGQDKGVRVGDRYSVVRPESDPSGVNWFKWQVKLMKAMGTHYLDAGQLRVVNVQSKTATAEVTLSCDYMQRGDIALPFQERPEPTFKDASAFDHFAPISGKPVAMVVQGTGLSAIRRPGQHSLREPGHQQRRKSRRLFSDIPLPRYASGACPPDQRVSGPSVWLWQLAGAV